MGPAVPNNHLLSAGGEPQRAEQGCGNTVAFYGVVLLTIKVLQ